MAEFLQIYPQTGFDAGGYQPWQMVPNGSSRYVILRDGAGLNVTAGPPTVRLTEINESLLPRASGPIPFAVLRQKGDRFFEILGTAAGSTEVVAEPSGRNAGARLSVKVMKLIIVGVRLYLVSDLQHRTNRTLVEVKKALDTVNDFIIYPQTNLKFELLELRGLQVNRLLKDELEVKGDEQTPDDEIRTLIYPLGSQDEGKNVFFVWKFQYDNVLGITHNRRNISIKDFPQPLDQLLAHELGHTLLGSAHSDDPQNLMYPASSRNALNLTSGQIITINSSAYE